MKKKVHLSYACPIPWDEMKTTGEKERFCGECKKNIRDFSKDEDPDTTGVECGRFSLSQVGSISRQYHVGKGTIATFSITTLMALSPQTGIAQTQTEQDTARKEIFKGGYYLSGIIRDEKTGKPLPFVNIIIKTAEGPIITGGTTNFDGHFEILLGADDLNQSDLIAEITFTGYQKTVLDSLEFDPRNSNKIIETCLKPSEEELDEITIEYTTTGLIAPDLSTTDGNSAHEPSKN